MFLKYMVRIRVNDWSVFTSCLLKLNDMSDTGLEYDIHFAYISQNSVSHN